MKNTIKVFGIIILAVISGFLFLACPNPEDTSTGDIPGIDPLFAISGSFASQNGGASNAKFYAASTDASAAQSMARNLLKDVQLTGIELTLEGVLEDGDITFRLKGSYNTVTERFILSAAGSFLRYSISGLKSDDTANIVVQVKNIQTGEWTDIVVSGAISSGGDKPDGNKSLQDEFENGIPQTMWGTWWGSESITKVNIKDVFYPGQYFYVIDAYTIKEYVLRYGRWNLEGYTCFFEGVTKSNGNNTVSGRVIFDYTDYEEIHKDHLNWHLEMVADYAEQIGSNTADAQTIRQALDDWTLKNDREWLAVFGKWATEAEEEREFLGNRWNELGFNAPPYFFKYFRKDAYTLSGEQLSEKLTTGNYYSGDKYYSDNAAEVDGFTALKNNTNILSRAEPVIFPETNVESFYAFHQNDRTPIISTKSYEVVNYNGYSNVLKTVNPTEANGAWAIAVFDMPGYKNKNVTVNFSAKVKRIGKKGDLRWQINNSVGGPDGPDFYPVVGNEILNASVNEWHTMSGEWTGVPSAEFPSLYLTAHKNNSETTLYYVADFTVTVTVNEVNEIKYDLGDFTWTNKDQTTQEDSSHVRGWDLSQENEIKSKIADGSIRYLVIGLDAASVEAANGLNGIGIIFNADGCSWDNDNRAFPWYWEEDKDYFNGWISYNDLTDWSKYGVNIYNNTLYLQYDLTQHPSYESFKEAISTAAWAQIGLDVSLDTDVGAWQDGGEWHPVRAAYFIEW